MATPTMITKDFFTVVNERQSIRKYDPNATISKEELFAMLIFL